MSRTKPIRSLILTAAMFSSLALPTAGLAATTSLRVSISSGGSTHVLSLRCEPVSGTLPRAEAACRQLANLADPAVAPTAPRMCLQGYPSWLSTVSFTGKFRGVPVKSLVQRDYSCWGSTRMSDLASALGVTPARLASLAKA